jgi:hypothetical protein
MVTTFFMKNPILEHYVLKWFFGKNKKPSFPRLFSVSCFWTFINVQKSKPKNTFGKNSRVQPKILSLCRR